MSKMTASIYRINKVLESVSGLDGIAAEIMENMVEPFVSSAVRHIQRNHPEANAFNYMGRLIEDVERDERS